MGRQGSAFMLLRPIVIGTVVRMRTFYYMEFTHCLDGADVVLNYIHLRWSTSDGVDYITVGVVEVRQLMHKQVGSFWGRAIVQCKGLCTCCEI